MVLELARFVTEKWDSMASRTKDLVSFKVDLTLGHCSDPGCLLSSALIRLSSRLLFQGSQVSSKIPCSLLITTRSGT